MTNITAIRSEYRTVQGGGTMNETQAKQLAKDAVGSEEGRAFIEDRLAHDSFDPNVRKILSDAVTKNESKGEKAVDAKTGLGPSSISGMEVGKVGNTNITIKSEIGSREGFDSKEQARAAAVLNGKPAVLVQDQSGKWHAGELAVDPKSLSGKMVASSPPGAKAVEQVNIPDPAALKAAKDAYAATPSKSHERIEAYRNLAAVTLGVDPSQVVFSNPDEVQPGKINLTYRDLDGGAADAQTGYVKGPKGPMTTATPTDGSDPGQATIIMNGDPTDTKKFQDTYLHESTHQAHDTMAKDLVGQWKNDKAGSKLAFPKWLDSQVAAGNLSRADAQVVKQSTDGRKAENKKGVMVDAHPTEATEALAYTKAFTGAFAKDTDAKSHSLFQLLGAAGRNPPEDVKKDIGRQLQELFDSLPPAKQKEFNDFMSSNSTVQGGWMKKYLPK